MQIQEIGRILAQRVRDVQGISQDTDYQEEVEEAFRTLMWACGFSNEEIETLLPSQIWREVHEAYESEDLVTK